MGLLGLKFRFQRRRWNRWARDDTPYTHEFSHGNGGGKETEFPMRRVFTAKRTVDAEAVASLQRRTQRNAMGHYVNLRQCEV